MAHQTPLSFLPPTGMVFFTCLHFLTNLSCIPLLADSPGPSPRSPSLPFLLLSVMLSFILSRPTVTGSPAILLVQFGGL